MRESWWKRPRTAGMAASCCVASLLLPAAAAAAEIRAGAYGHALTGSDGEPDGVNASAEFLFDSPDFLSWALAPRPRLGGTLDLNGGTSLAYVDLGWTFDLGRAFFVDASVGGAIHDGPLETASDKENAYGCRLNFHETLSLGYRVTPAISVMLTGEHMSNASLCDGNDGLTNVGLRFGYDF
jgi:lipid A 3-O-deacylase